MAVEDDTLATLKRIEKLLSGVGVTSGLGRAPVAPRGAGTQRSNETTQDRENNKNNQSSRKTFRATTTSLNGLSEASNNLNRSFWGLGKTVMNTRANFIEMNRSMRAYTRNAPTANLTGGQERVPEGADAMAGLGGILTRTLTTILRRADRNPINRPGDGRVDVDRPRPAPRVPNPGDGRVDAEGPRRLRRGSRGPRVPNPGDVLADVAGPRGPGGRLANELGGLAGRINVAGIAFGVAMNALVGVVGTLVDDVLMLHSAGIQASSALGGLYIDAARSGMSLQDYTKVLQDSSVVVARSSSMADFAATLQTTKNQLAGLGFFGEQATKLGSAMQSSAVSLGVPFDQLTQVTRQQTDVFAQLRKTSLMTAEQLQSLTSELGNNQEVQSQLLGMAPAQRASRLNELMQIRTIGYSMGATKEASDALGKALIEQRKMTVPQKFQARGLLSQMAAFTGMDMGRADELGRLQMMAESSRTSEQTARMVALLAEAQTGLQAKMNSDDLGTRNIAEQFATRAGGAGLTGLLQTSANATQSQQSKVITPGEKVNKDFAQGVDGLLQFVGEANALLKGLEKNPVVTALATVIGSGAFALLLGTAMGRALSGTLPSLLPRILGGGGPRPVPLDLLGGGPPAPTRGIIASTRAAISGAFDILKRLTDFGRMGPTIAGIGASISGAAASVMQALGSATAHAMHAGQNAIQFGKNLLSGTSTIGGAIQNAIQALRSGITAGIQGAGGLAQSIFGTASSVMKGIFTGGFRLLGGSGVIGSVIGGVMEMFTGDLASALTSTGDKEWFSGGLKGFLDKGVDKVGDIVGAMIRGFGTGIAGLGDLLIGVWNWSMGSFFENLKVDLGSTLVNFFDQSWTGMLIMFKELKFKILDKLGMGDSAWAKELKEDIKVSEATRTELQKGGDRTLTTVGDANQKAVEAQKKTADKTKAAVDSTTKSVAAAAGVITSTQGLTSSILGTAQEISTRKSAERVAAPTPSATVAVVATPAPSPVKNVTEPTVNKPVEVAATPAPAPTTVEAAPVATPTDVLITQLGVMTGILQQMLTAEQLQAAGLEGLARSVGRTAFTDNETQFLKLQRTA